MSTDDERLAAYLETGELPAELDAAERAELERWRRGLADPAVWAQPPPELQGAVRAAIRELARPEPEAAGEVEERDTDPAQHPGAASPPRGSARARAARRWFTASTVAAAALGAAAALLGVVLIGQLTRPGAVVVELAGTELAAEASAVATITPTPSGQAIRLDPRGLGPAPPGFYYQGWLRAEDRLVTIGTFHLRGGAEPVDLWAGVDLAGFDTLTVTLEPDDADPASSGRVVLRGDLPAPP